MLALDDIKKVIGERCPVVRSVDMPRKGLIRIETGLQYPEGAQIDVFIADNTPLLNTVASNNIRLTDLGHTMGWLLDMNVRPWTSKRRQAFVADVLRQYGADQDGAALVLDCDQMQISAGILRLAQVCLRVSDLMFTRRSSLHVPFSDDVEEVLADAELIYEKDPELHGRSGPVRVDYLVQGPQRRSAVLALSAMNAQTAHDKANEIFKRWYNLNAVPGNDFQRVTIYDDRQEVYRREDLRDLEEFSIVLPFSEKQTIADVFLAA